jgi:Lon-like ATP-dependent protease
VEVYFNQLSRENIEKILRSTCERLSIMIDDCAVNLISMYAKNGRDAVKILQMAKNIICLEGKNIIGSEEAVWTLNACRYTNGRYFDGDEKIIDISVIKPKEKNS